MNDRLKPMSNIERWEDLSPEKREQATQGSQKAMKAKSDPTVVDWDGYAIPRFKAMLKEIYGKKPK
jgi:hypothetical protein